MPQDPMKFWEDVDLIDAANSAFQVFCRLFDLSRTDSTVHDFDQALAQIGKVKLSAEQMQIILEAGDCGFEVDAEEGQRRIRPFDSLADALFRDYREEARAKVEGVLQSQPEKAPSNPDAVVREMLALLFWKILLKGPGLASAICNRGSFLDWLDQTADRAAERFGQKSPIFESWDILRGVGNAWERIRKKLELPEGTRGYDREDIEQKREDLAKRRLKKDRVTDREIREAVRWPQEIQDFTRILMDPDQTRDFEVVAKWHGEKELQKWAEDHPDLVPPELDDVVNEFKGLKVWQAIKNARDWFRQRRPNAPSWAPRFFDELSKDAYKAINYLKGLPANHGRYQGKRKQEDKGEPGKPLPREVPIPQEQEIPGREDDPLDQAAENESIGLVRRLLDILTTDERYAVEVEYFKEPNTRKWKSGQLRKALADALKRMRNHKFTDEDP